MAYVIMRAKKLSSVGAVAASMQHNFRERETPNADPLHTPANEHRAARSTEEAMNRLHELLPTKHRKDAVLAVEYVVTASPEWWEQTSQAHHQTFFDRSIDWLQAKYGAGNVLVATIQRDEKTPHLSAFVVPKTLDGRLSAKEFIGNRQKMSADQSTLAERMRDLGLERGIEGSRAKHKRVKQFYAEIGRGEPAPLILSPAALEPRVLKKGFLMSDIEAPLGVAQRINATAQKHYAPAVEQAREARLQAHRAREMAQTAQTKDRALKTAQERLQALSQHLMPMIELATLAKDQFQELMQQAQIRVQVIKQERAQLQQRQAPERALGRDMKSHDKKRSRGMER